MNAKIWDDFDDLMAKAKRGEGYFYYGSYGRAVIVKGKALDNLRKGRSLFLIGSKFLHPMSLGFQVTA